jgi:hypothetical protein
VQPIDVIYVVYGVPHLTLLSLQHLLASGTPINRLIVFDNHPDDHASHEALARLLAPPHVYVRQRDNPGVYVTLNRALALTETRFVLLASSDFFVWHGWCAPVLDAMEHKRIGWGGPDWIDGDWATTGVQGAWQALSEPYPTAVTFGKLTSHHAVLDWHRLRAEVGPFDERFFFTFGDTDYMERMRDAQVDFGVVGPRRGVHAVQQSRATVPADTNVHLEMWDETLFRDKWAGRPDILARHPPLGSFADRVRLREQRAGREWEAF